MPNSVTASSSRTRGGLWIRQKFLKPLVRLIEKILPKSAFGRFYSFSFPIYKFFVRQVYFFGAILGLDFSDVRKWARAKYVYSVAPYSLVGMSGLEATYDEGIRLNEAQVPGDFVELGVARGGCAALMAFAAFDKSNPVPRNLWLFDSYEGLPNRARTILRKTTRPAITSGRSLKGPVWVRWKRCRI